MEENTKVALKKILLHINTLHLFQLYLKFLIVSTGIFSPSSLRLNVYSVLKPV